MASRNEVYEGNLIRVYHDIKRREYTLLYIDKCNTNGFTYDALVIHKTIGISHTTAQPGSHLGRRIPVKELPDSVRNQIRWELGLEAVQGT